MRTNLGKTDKYLRIFGGILIILTGIIIQSLWGALGVMLLVTAAINWCPLYALLKINTRNK